MKPSIPAFLLSLLLCVGSILPVIAQDRDSMLIEKGVPKNLEDCFLPAQMVDRIYNYTPKQMLELKESFQQNTRIEGEEVVLSVGLRFMNDHIVGFYRMVPIRTMNVEKAERVYFQFPVEWCCLDDSAKEKFCTASITETFDYDTLHPKHTPWLQKQSPRYKAIEEKMINDSIKKEYDLTHPKNLRNKKGLPDSIQLAKDLAKKLKKKGRNAHLTSDTTLLSDSAKMIADSIKATQASHLKDKKNKFSKKKTTIIALGDSTHTDSSGALLPPPPPAKKDKKKKNDRKTVITELPNNSDSSTQKTDSTVAPSKEVPPTPIPVIDKKEKRKKKETVIIPAAHIPTDSSVTAADSVPTPTVIPNKKDKKSKKADKKTVITELPNNTDSSNQKVDSSVAPIKEVPITPAPVIDKKEKRKKKETVIVPAAPIPTDSSATTADSAHTPTPIPAIVPDKKEKKSKKADKKSSISSAVETPPTETTNTVDTAGQKTDNPIPALKEAVAPANSATTDTLTQPKQPAETAKEQEKKTESKAAAKKEAKEKRNKAAVAPKLETLPAATTDSIPATPKPTETTEPKKEGN